jgi:hypothetical protein
MEGAEYMKPKTIETAPKDGTKIMVFAKWGWDIYTPKDEPYWAVARYGKWEKRFVQTSENPYEDYATDATHWMPVPPDPA